MSSLTMQNNGNRADISRNDVNNENTKTQKELAKLRKSSSHKKQHRDNNRGNQSMDQN